MRLAQKPAVTGLCVAPRPEASLPYGYIRRGLPRKVATALRAQASALQAFRVVAPGGGSPPPRRAALERLVVEAVARVRVVVNELRADGADMLEQHFHAELLAALSPDVGGPDAAA